MLKQGEKTGHLSGFTAPTPLRAHPEGGDQRYAAKTRSSYGLKLAAWAGARNC